MKLNLDMLFYDLCSLNLVLRTPNWSVQLKMAERYFKCMGKCCKPSIKTLSNAGIQRIFCIISASRQRQDALPIDLRTCINLNTDYTIACHRSCVSTYTSTQRIARLLDKRPRSSSEPLRSQKRVKRSENNFDFNFKTHCIFCGVHSKSKVFHNSFQSLSLHT